MKKLLFIFILFFSIQSYSQDDKVGYAFVKPQTMNYDHQKHFVGGGVIGFSSYYFWLQKFELDRTKAKDYAIYTSAFSGAMVETIQLASGKTWNLGDAVITTVGGVIASYFADFLRGLAVRSMLTEEQKQFRKLQRQQKRNNR